VGGQCPATYRQFYTGNASVLKRHILEAGGFNPHFRRAEDVELALRLRDRGLHFVFLPEARGWHYVHRSYASWLHMSDAYGRADLAMARAGRPEVLELIPREFARRNTPVRALTQLCVGRPARAYAAIALLGLVIQGAGDGLRPLGNAACSLVFNLGYYNGLARALGGREAFMDLLAGRNIGTPQRVC